MAATKSKKSLSKRKTQKAKTSTKYTRPYFLDPHGIVIPCMPLRALLNMLNQEYLNPFYAGKDRNTNANVGGYEYDVFKGWLISKKRFHDDRKFEIEWLMKLPRDYSIAHFGRYFSGDNEIPSGDWIGPTHILKMMHEKFTEATDRVSDLMQLAFKLPWPDHNTESLPKEVEFDDFVSEGLDDVYWRELLKSRP